MISHRLILIAIDIIFNDKTDKELKKFNLCHIHEIKDRRGGKISLASVNKCCCRNFEIIPVTHRIATPAESFF